MPLPNSLPWMEGADAKLARAKQHLSTFHEQAKAFVAQARPRFIRKTNGATHWLVFYVEDPFPPLELGAVIGDLLFNLRSSLDNLVCGLVLTTNADSSCGGRQFPIRNIADDYDEIRRKALKGVPAAAVRIITELQPFQRPESTRDQDPLWILNTLCNRDKHRQLLLTLCCHREVQLDIPLRNGGHLSVRLPKDFYAGDVETVPLPGDPRSIDDNVQIAVRGRSDVRFRANDAWSHRSVAEILEACVRYVEEHVIIRLRPYFDFQPGQEGTVNE